ncbi:MAG: hypothetical protein IJV37_05725 [Bacteroidales bacterium]|nr:hypothetical protein [Bacteroidales bacterium]
MKKTVFALSLAALAALASCNKSDNSPRDVRTFGLTGDVREVRYSVVSISNSLDEEEGDPWLEQDELLLSFDEQGRVTRDDYGNVYEYDADGHYCGPYAQYTEVVRDASGRLKSFNNTAIPEEQFDGFDIMSYCDVTYDYDAKGRVVTETYYGWEWGTTSTYTYDGNHPWPARITQTGYDEGYNENAEITYDYLEFDARGNWTKREVTAVTESYEEDAEDEKETYTTVTQEIRTITYWSDKN